MNAYLSTTTAPYLATASTLGHRSVQRSTPWNRLILFLGGVAAVGLIFFAVLVFSFRMGGEARAVRHALFAAAPEEWTPEFEFGVGRLPALLARSGIRLAQSQLDLPPEALAGIAAFRSADVGIYHRSHPSNNRTRAQAMEGVDLVMRERDWEPVVSVQDGDDCVQVFVPKSLDSHRDTQACVFVMERNQLVIVSARIDLEPLLGIAEHHLAKHALRKAK